MSNIVPTTSQSFARALKASGPAFVNGLVAAFLTIGTSATAAPQRTLTRN